MNLHQQKAPQTRLPRPVQTAPSKVLLQKLVKLQTQGKHTQARMRLAKLLPKYPKSVALLNIAGAVFGKLGEVDQAVRAFEAALQLDPSSVETLCNLAYMHYEARDYASAAETYCSALEMAPDHRIAQTNLGNCMLHLNEKASAVACFELVLKRHPNDGATHMLKARALYLLGRLLEARESYRIAARLLPQSGAILAHIDDINRQLCDWSALAEVTPDRIKACAEPPPPFSTLPMADDPDWQLSLSRAHAARLGMSPGKPPHRGSGAERVRVGVFSADFHTHATMDLLSGVFREHDRARFEYVLYSYGPGQGGSVQAELSRQVSKLHDVSAATNAQIQARALADKLDIAIDLKGYTADSRSDVFATRLAPVQINYLGYPGTLGSAAFDYIIADEIIVPPELEAAYAEKILRLPHCYQPNENQRKIPQTQTTRVDFGLREDAFVLCCFNNPYKISPQEFAIWMRVMRQAEHAQLWLLPRHAETQQNLRAEAERHNIDPDRIVFAQICAGPDHLARQKHADLFVDCFNVNAHTTASDALWAGLPLVAKLGHQFAARVSASLLHAVGLPDMVARTDEDYEALILSLVTDKDRYAEVKRRLEANLRTAPLFDTVRYTRDFEAALLSVHAAQRR